jgi:hypothetical protein
VLGETLSANRPDTGHVLPGGKGANQAVGVAKLLSADSTYKTHWCGRFGNDTHATMLKKVLAENDVDASLASDASVPSGQAYILRLKDGQNSIILVGAANHVSRAHACHIDLLSCRPSIACHHTVCSLLDPLGLPRSPSVLAFLSSRSPPLLLPHRRRRDATTRDPRVREPICGFFCSRRGRPRIPRHGR